VRLFRVFSWNRYSSGSEPGGPAFVPRQLQGSGRHDNPSLYGAFYCSVEPISCIAEALQPFRGQWITQGDLARQEGRTLALASFELPDRIALIDLDSPKELATRQLRPSGIATSDRRRTQTLAAQIFQEKVAGFFWWSTLESLWMNCTLFHERVVRNLSVAVPPQPLRLDDSALIAAANQIGVLLGSRK
jgi:hypothetical protein